MVLVVLHYGGNYALGLGHMWRLLTIHIWCGGISAAFSCRSEGFHVREQETTGLACAAALGVHRSTSKKMLLFGRNHSVDLLQLSDIGSKLLTSCRDPQSDLVFVLTT